MGDKYKAYVCGRSITGVADSNPAGGMDVFPLCLLCAQRPLRQADHSSRGVLPIVYVLFVRVQMQQ
jgi:hypothetical protein